MIFGATYRLDDGLDVRLAFLGDGVESISSFSSEKVDDWCGLLIEIDTEVEAFFFLYTAIPISTKMYFSLSLSEIYLVPYVTKWDLQISSEYNSIQDLFFNDDFGSSFIVFRFPVHPTILPTSSNSTSLYFIANRSEVTTDLTLSLKLSTEMLWGRSCTSGAENGLLLTLISWEGFVCFLVVYLTCSLKCSLKWLWWKCCCEITSFTLLKYRWRFDPHVVLFPSIINGFWASRSQSLASIN